MKTWLILNTFVLCAAVLAPGSSQAQNGPTYEWAPTDAIHLPDSVSVFRINYKREKGDAIAIVSPRGVELGSDIPLPDNVLGIAAYQGHVAVFYQPEQKSENRELHVRELDPRTGATLQDKVFYSVSTPDFVSFVVERDAEGRLKAIMARTTAWETKHQNETPGMDRAIEQMGQTNGLVLLLPEKGLSARVVKLPAGGGRYWGSVLNDKGAFFFVSSSETQLIVEKFSTGGTGTGAAGAASAGALESKLATPFDPQPAYDDYGGFHPVVQTSLDATTGNALVTDVVFMRRHARHPISRTMRFDFTDGKVNQTPEVMVTKGFLGQIQPGSRNANLHIDYFRPVDMLQTSDYIIAVKELDWEDVFTDNGGGMQSTSTTHYRDMAVIQIYDKQLNLLRTVPIIKSLTMNMPIAAAISVHLEGDNLYAFTAENPPPHKPGVREYLYTINVGTGAISRQQGKKDRDFRTYLTVPQYLYWFQGGSCFVNHIYRTTMGFPQWVKSAYGLSAYEPVHED